MKKKIVNQKENVEEDKTIVKITKILMDISGIISILIYILLQTIPANVSEVEKLNYECLGDKIPNMLDTKTLLIISVIVYLLMLIIGICILKHYKTTFEKDILISICVIVACFVIYAVVFCYNDKFHAKTSVPRCNSAFQCECEPEDETCNCKIFGDTGNICNIECPNNR